MLEDSYEPEDYGKYSFLQYGGGSLVFDDQIVPLPVQEAVNAKYNEIKDGLFRVNINDTEPKPTM
jgi:basic membrane protein A